MIKFPYVLFFVHYFANQKHCKNPLLFLRNAFPHFRSALIIRKHFINAHVCVLREFSAIAFFPGTSDRKFFFCRNDKVAFNYAFKTSNANDTRDTFAAYIARRCFNPKGQVRKTPESQPKEELINERV